MPEYRLVKHRGNYSLAYTDDERGRVRIALGTADTGTAEARARDIWQKRTAPVSERVEDLWKSYIRDRKAHDVIVDGSGSTWRALEPSFGHKIGTAINRDDCRAHYAARKKQGRSDSTIRTEVELLRACLRLRYGAAAPVLWMPPASKPRDRYLTKPELLKVLESVETPHIRLFIELAVATGARMTALLQLTWDRVDLDRGVIDLNPGGRHATNKRRAVVPITERAKLALTEAKAAALSDYVIEYAGEPVASVRKAIRSAAARSGVQCSPHVFRHTAGVWMAEADVPMQKIAQYLGHTSTRVTETVYARYSPSFMRDASAALEF